MSGGVATILVGALTAPELGEKKDRYEDAVNAVRATIEQGYIAGAGSPLLWISYRTYDIKNLPLAQQTAFKMYMKAIRTPAKLLIKSTGEDSEGIIPKILSQADKFGFDAKESEVKDLILAGIVDPYKVIYNSIIYSTNVAEAFMSIDAVISSDLGNLTISPLDEVLQENEIFGF
jgi:chaperonin GroEL